MAKVFEKWRIGSMRARNRLVRAATAESLATPSGCPTSQLIDLYGALARGGVGVIVTGYAYVTPDGKPSEGALSLCDDSFAGEYRRLVDAVHAEGAALVAQLVYGGSKSKIAPDDVRRTASAGTEKPNAAVMGPSAIEHPQTRIVPHEASAAELSALVESFGAAARRACDWAFDGIEIHAAHGYLLSQFLSRRFNVRDDEYGGRLENRARMPIECVRAARAATAPDFPILVKLNSCDNLRDPSGAEGGLGEGESMQVAAWLVDAGASAIEVSGDWHAASQGAGGGEGPYFAEFGRKLAHTVDAPIIVTGGWRRFDDVCEHLQSGAFDAVGMCRPFVCEPDLARRWQSGDVAPSICTGCGSCARKPGIPCPMRRGC